MGVLIDSWKSKISNSALNIHKAPKWCHLVEENLSKLSSICVEKYSKCFYKCLCISKYKWFISDMYVFHVHTHTQYICRIYACILITSMYISHYVTIIYWLNNSKNNYDHKYSHI